MAEQKFHVGDIVRVIDSPVDCVFTWVSGMNEFCGREAEIVRIDWSDRLDTWRICLDVDNGQFMWDENCIALIEDEVNIDPISSDVLLDFM